MFPGFQKRLVQEIRHFMTQRAEFEELKLVAPFVKCPENIYAPNLSAWVGASILMSLGQEVDKFLLTKEEYTNNDE